MGKKWLTEEQVCNLIWKDCRASFEQDFAITDTLCWCREYEIAYALRPDFIRFGAFEALDGQRSIDIIEVKISADAESVAQLANYVWVTNKHVEQLHEDVFRSGIHTYKPWISGYLIARTFDKSVYSLAGTLGIVLLRFNHKEDSNGITVSLEPEQHCYENSPLDLDHMADLKFRLAWANSKRREVSHV